MTANQPAARPASMPIIPALTGIRFFAAFFILFAHASDWIAQFQGSEVRRYLSFVAMYGMPLFFVLSGFVIQYNYRKLFTEKSFGRAVCEFGISRFSRLFPLYLCLLVFAIMADNFVGRVQGQGDIWWRVLAYDVTLTQSWWYAVYSGQIVINWLFPLAWSISTEMFFYAGFAVFAFAVLAIKTPRQGVIVSAAYALIVIGALIEAANYQAIILAVAQQHIAGFIGMEKFQDSFYRWLLYFSPYVRVLEFFMGALSAQVFVLLLDRPIRKSETYFANVAIVVVLASLVFFGVCTFIDYGMVSTYVRFLSSNFLCAPSLAFLLFYLARYKSMLSRFMGLPILVMLGNASYAIYLIHTWTLRIFVRGPAPELNWLWGTEAALRVIVAIIFTLVVSYAVYIVVDLPSYRWLRGRLRAAVG